jgi:hypothetical protein
LNQAHHFPAHDWFKNLKITRLSTMQYAIPVNQWFTNMVVNMAPDQAKASPYKLALLAQAVPDDLVLPREWLLQQGFTDDNLTGYVRWATWLASAAPCMPSRN